MRTLRIFLALYPQSLRCLDELARVIDSTVHHRVARFELQLELLLNAVKIDAPLGSMPPPLGRFDQASPCNITQALCSPEPEMLSNSFRE